MSNRTSIDDTQKKFWEEVHLQKEIESEKKKKKQCPGAVSGGPYGGFSHSCCSKVEYHCLNCGYAVCFGHWQYSRECPKCKPPEMEKIIDG